MKPNPFSLCVAALFLIAAVVEAQTIWNDKCEKTLIRLEYLGPNFPSQFPGREFSCQILTLNGAIQVTDFVRVTLEIPYIREASTNPFASESRSGVGNAFVGVQVGVKEFPLYGELGARPILRQTLGDFSIAFGGYFGDYERGEVYFKEITSYQAMINVASTKREGFVYRVRVGPSIWVPEGASETTTFLDYGVKLGYDDGGLSLYGAITGRWNTEQQSGKAAYHFAGFDLGYRIGPVRPAVFVRLPLDKDLKELTDRTVGGSVSVEF